MKDCIHNIGGYCRKKTEYWYFALIKCDGKCSVYRNRNKDNKDKK